MLMLLSVGKKIVNYDKKKGWKGNKIERKITA